MRNTPVQDFVWSFHDMYVNFLLQESSNLLQCRPQIEELYDKVNKWCNEFFESENFYLLVDKDDSSINVDAIKQKRASINECYVQISVRANALQNRMGDVQGFSAYALSASFLLYMVNEMADHYNNLLRLGMAFAEHYNEFTRLTKEANNSEDH